MTDVLGSTGVLLILGIAFFFYIYSNSVKLFSWIDQQTYGKRDYILKKLEIMFIEIDPQKVTVGLLVVSLGSGILSFIIIALLGKIFLAIFVSVTVTIVGWKIPIPVVDYFENKRKKNMHFRW
jgi:tight adherence protein B